MHRIGQKSFVNIQYILGKNTLDEQLWPLLQRKLEILGETLNGEEEHLNAHIQTIRNRKDKGSHSWTGKRVNTLDSYVFKTNTSMKAFVD